MLDLYARTWDGQPLGADEYVISADEKTSIQARCRGHPTAREAGASWSEVGLAVDMTRQAAFRRCRWIEIDK